MRRHHLIVIDDVDYIFSTRASKSSGSSKEVSSHHPHSSHIDDFFFSLIDLMDSSPYISVILTTSSSSKLDSALLDRVGEVVSLTIPSDSFRFDVALLKMREHLRQLLTSGEIDILDELCQGMVSVSDSNSVSEVKDNSSKPKDKSKKNVSAGATGITSAYTKARALFAEKMKIFKKPDLSSMKKFISSQDFNFGISSNSTAGSHSDDKNKESEKGFSVVKCALALSLCSTSWSHRDLVKMVFAVRSKVLGSESCVLSSEIWMEELFRFQIDKERIEQTMAN